MVVKNENVEVVESLKAATEWEPGEEGERGRPGRNGLIMYTRI